MKKLFMRSLQLMLAVALVSISAGNAFSQTHTNYVKIKGHIMNYEGKTTVQVFEHNPSTDLWTLKKETKRLENYVVTMNPTLDYQVWFTNNDGETKILYHNGGTKGLWVHFLDVDFNATTYGCRMEQYDEDLYSFIPIMEDDQLASINAYRSK